MAAIYNLHDSDVKMATNSSNTLPAGKPTCRNANGRPTKQPPMQVLMRARAASQVVRAWWSSPASLPSAVLLALFNATSARND